MATIYVDVPVREDRLPEVFELLSKEPLDLAKKRTRATDEDDSHHEPVAQDGGPDNEADDERDDARWDAFWAVPDNVREHLAQRSDMIHAITRAIAEHADDGWITTDDIAADIGASPSSVASALGPLGRYLTNRDLDWPFRWKYDNDGKVVYQMASAVAAVILDIL